MPESLLDLKRKITSIKQTGQITEAMRMVSGAKLSQTEKRDKGYTLYNERVRMTLSHLMSSQIVDHLHQDNRQFSDEAVADLNFADVFDLGVSIDLIQPRKEINKTGYLVIGGDRGLVGSYNSQIIKNMMSVFQDAKAADKKVEILSVGSVPAQFFKKQQMDVVYEYSGISDVPTFKEVRPIVSTAIKMYLNGVFDELYVCYTHHVNTLSSAFRVEKMLPISDIEISSDAADNPIQDYIVAPDLNTVVSSLLPQFARSMIYGAILDAKTAEHASSMTAMQSASKNADDIVSGLTTQLNRARQAQITTEITEIISGANALE